MILKGWNRVDHQEKQSNWRMANYASRLETIGIIWACSIFSQTFLQPLQWCHLRLAIHAHTPEQTFCRTLNPHQSCKSPDKQSFISLSHLPDKNYSSYHDDSSEFFGEFRMENESSEKRILCFRRRVYWCVLVIRVSSEKLAHPRIKTTRNFSLWACSMIDRNRICMSYWCRWRIVC